MAIANRNVTWAIILAVSFHPLVGQAAPPKAPNRVDVLPVFFIPAGEAPPTEMQADRLTRHLNWAQKRYAELLPGGVTFEISQTPAVVYQSSHPLSFYKPLPANATPQMMGELLVNQRLTPVTCPHVLLMVVMNSHDGYPAAGGQPFNGGNNNGGGGVAISSFDLDGSPNLQSTLQHELGHAFGLPHVDVYGMSMVRSPSIMSYNPTHHTNGFEPSPTPGRFVPEDLRALALNQRAFPGLTFNPRRDIPIRYSIRPAVTLGPMPIPK